MCYEDYSAFYDASTVCLYSGDTFKYSAVRFNQTVGGASLLKFRIKEESEVIFKVTQF